jgi:hypothetical protein
MIVQILNSIGLILVGISLLMHQLNHSPEESRISVVKENEMVLCEQGENVWAFTKPGIEYLDKNCEVYDKQITKLAEWLSSVTEEETNESR